MADETTTQTTAQPTAPASQPAQPAENLQVDEVRKEPAFILDTTGSMEEPAAEGSSMTKIDLAYAITKILATELGAEDSQAADEDPDEKGGLLTVTFADGVADELGDLNPENFEEKWQSINWGGGTYIVPAFDMAKENFDEEFGKLPVNVQPKLALGVLTDGALGDLNAATRWLEQVKGNTYVYVILVGYGSEHDRALAQWQGIADNNVHVKVQSVGSSTDADAIAKDIISMLQ